MGRLASPFMVPLYCVWCSLNRVDFFELEDYSYMVISEANLTVSLIWIRVLIPSRN